MIVTNSVTEVNPRKAVLEMPEYHPPLAERTALRLDFVRHAVAQPFLGDIQPLGQGGDLVGRGDGGSRQPLLRGLRRDGLTEQAELESQFRWRLDFLGAALERLLQAVGKRLLFVHGSHGRSVGVLPRVL